MENKEVQLTDVRFLKPDFPVRSSKWGQEVNCLQQTPTRPVKAPLTKGNPSENSYGYFQFDIFLHKNNNLSEMTS